MIRFKRWEKALLMISFLLALFAGSFLISGRSLYAVIFHSSDSSFGSQKKIGKLAQGSGEVKRQELNGDLFKVLSLGSPIYDEDIITTGDNGSAHFSLDDGSTVDLASNTMVKMTLQSKISYQGINRSADLEIVGGEVKVSPERMTIFMKNGSGEIKKVDANQKGDWRVLNEPIFLSEGSSQIIESTMDSNLSKPETASLESLSPQAGPKDFSARSGKRLTGQIVSPVKGAQFKLKSNSTDLSIPIQIEMNTPVVDALYGVKISKIDGKDAGREVANRELKSLGKNLFFPLVLTEAGKYRIEGGKEPVEITVLADFEGIHVLPYLRSDDGITLVWKKVPTAKNYYLRAFREQSGKRTTLFQSITESESYPLDKDKLLKPFSYEIIADLESGFKVHSPIVNLGFTMEAPEPVAPLDGVVIAPGTLLLTWKKTPFVEQYELEVFSDRMMSKKILASPTKENFYYWRRVGRGTFFWRVRATATAQKGKFSPLKSFECR